MYSKTSLAIIALICLSLLMISTPAEIDANPKFVIASWAYPDQYGQGIEKFTVLENSSGSWVQVGGFYSYDETTVLDWNATVGIKLRCWTWLNSTLTGADNLTDGRRYFKHDVTVTYLNGTVVFSQQNFTYGGGSIVYWPLYWYTYEVVLNFLPEFAQTYYVTIGYDVFYSETTESVVAYAGSAVNWEKTWTKNLQYWTIGGIKIWQIYFDIPDVDYGFEVIGFYYHCYGEGFDPTVTYEVFNGVSNITLFTWDYGKDWFNGTYIGDMLNETTLLLNYHSFNITGGASTDFFEILFIYEGWHELTDAELVFDLYTEPALAYVDMWLVFAGLLLIPASTLYLVKGGRDEMSSDKFFYFIIAFIIGWALLLGGIMP